MIELWVALTGQYIEIIASFNDIHPNYNYGYPSLLTLAHNSVANIHNWIMDTPYWIVDIHSYVFQYP